MEMRLKKYYFFAFALIGLSIYGMQKIGIQLPWFANNYLNDILCIPLVLKTAQYITQHLRSDPFLKIPILLQCLVVLIFILYFEVILPKISERYTADIYDVLAYILGMCIFLILERRTALGHIK
jgi:Na+/glutamate symporter